MSNNRDQDCNNCHDFNCHQREKSQNVKLLSRKYLLISLDIKNKFSEQIFGCPLQMKFY